MKCFLLNLLVIFNLCVHDILCINNTHVSLFTLEQVHVLFRHGDRRPDEYCSEYNGFPDDDYFPEGPGGLTSLGKEQEFNIGRALRERYDYWLGSVYTPSLLSARSTDRPRTKMSLLLALAGLFPPSTELIWNWELNWQPIPIDFEKWETDTLLGWPGNCPKFLEEYQNALNSTTVQQIIETNQFIFDYVFTNSYTPEVKSFSPSRPFEYMFGVYFCADALERNGKAIPEWVKPLYPETLRILTTLEYQIKTFNNLLVKYTGGQLLKKIIDDAMAKISGELKPKGRKLFLYSGHEYNVAHTLRSLYSFVPHIPPYSAYILFELHNIGWTHGFRVLYQDYQYTEPRPIILPGCSEVCPIDDFIKILKDNLPGPDIKC